MIRRISREMALQSLFQIDIYESVRQSLSLESLGEVDYSDFTVEAALAAAFQEHEEEGEEATMKDAIRSADAANEARKAAIRAQRQEREARNARIQAEKKARWEARKAAEAPKAEAKKEVKPAKKEEK